MIPKASVIRNGKRALWFAVMFCVLAAGSYVNGQLIDYVSSIVMLSGIAIIMAVSLNIVNGINGQFSIGHAGFMAVGAYTGASVTYFADKDILHNHPAGVMWLLPAVLAGGTLAAICGYLVAAPSLRLRGDYLAIVTLGFGEIVRILISNSSDINRSLKYLGGAVGFVGYSGAYLVPHIATFVPIFASVFLVVLFTRNYKFSGYGLAAMSVREDEIASEAMGVNTTRTKTTAFILSAFFAGVGGALYAHQVEFFNPLDFSFLISMNYVIMVVLGGSGSITGSVLAAVVLTALPELLKPVQSQFHLSDAYRQVIYAIMLVIMMLLRPEGVFGRGELGWKWKKKKHSEPMQSSERVNPTSFAPHKSENVVIDVENLTRRFGGLTAVSSMNFLLKQGELVGLIGPNGAGKTTVFNMLTGVYAPSEGKIEFQNRLLSGEIKRPPLSMALFVLRDCGAAAIVGWVIGTILSSSLIPDAGSNASLQTRGIIFYITILIVVIFFGLIPAIKRHRNLPPLKPHQFAARGISRTFQNIRLFSNLTVLENVMVASHLRKRTNLFDALFGSYRLAREDAEYKTAAEDLLSQFELLDVKNELARNLPYGDQRRLEIVRALATKPQLLLLDEPAAGMNTQEKIQLMELIRRVRDEFSLTILLIEHDMHLVMGICERIYVLDYGRIIAEGSPDEIKSNPAVISAYLGEEFEQEPEMERSS